MPSSFTPLLKLELPATGELSGTWGTTVNNAITTPLSEAVAGTTTITVGGSDYTLSNGDGSAANEARKMFIVATGTPGAGRNVICPAASKFYVFRNDTNQTLTLKTLSGTGIAVPAGQYRFLYCDGTNVVETFNAMASLMLGTALAAASGGTGQSSYTAGDLLYATGTTALSKLGIGAANRVLTSSGTAPQWVTSLTGLTGVSSSSITNTSLTATRLVYSTTGGAQTDSANLTFDGTSLTINGSPNLILSSSGIERGRIVTGTGAVELMAGSTTTPTISMASNVATFTNNPVLSGGTANGVLYLDGSKVATSGSALTFDGTNLAVGISSSATYKARIYGGNGKTLLLDNDTSQYTELWFANNGTTKSVLGFNNISGDFAVLNTNTGGALLLGVNGSEQMRLTTTGLGIGTNNPATRVHAMSSSSSLSFGLSPSNSNTNIGYVTNDSTYIMFASGYGATGQKFRVALQAPDNSATLDASGNLGIGTGSPSQPLHVRKSADGVILLDSSTAGYGTFFAQSGFAEVYLGSLNNYNLGIYTNGTKRATFDTSGNLGLGVTPSAWSSYKAIELPNGVALAAYSGGAQAITSLSNNAYWNGTNWIYKVSSSPAAQHLMPFAGGHQWLTAPSGTAGNAISFTQALTLDANRNLLLNGTSAGASAVGTLAIFNGTAPTGSVTDGIILYAEDVSSSSELKVRDEAGNVTTLSPHNFSLIPEGPSEDMAWAYYSEKDGKRINVDMLKLARMVEKLTGEKLVYSA